MLTTLSASETIRCWTVGCFIESLVWEDVKEGSLGLILLISTYVWRNWWKPRRYSELSQSANAYKSEILWVEPAFSMSWYSARVRKLWVARSFWWVVFRNTELKQKFEGDTKLRRLRQLAWIGLSSTFLRVFVLVNILVFTQLTKCDVDVFTKRILFLIWP
jgi:hypothetical protein